MKYTYFDAAAAMPTEPVGVEAMARALQESWGHPRALHAIGGRAALALDEARQQVADYLDVPAYELVFTRGGSDALHIGWSLLEEIVGEAKVLSSALEHPSVRPMIAANGRVVEELALPAGIPNDDDRALLEQAHVALLSACNHELGTLMDWSSFNASAWRLVDAVQLAPWRELRNLNDDRTLYAVSGAKLGAPLGVGVLRLPSPMAHRLRAADRRLEDGAVPWALAVAMGATCAERAPRREAAREQATARVEVLWHKLRALEPEAVRNGAEGAWSGPLLNISFPGRSAKSLVSALSLARVCIAHTASCRSSDEELSPGVARAYADEPWRARGATRWSASEHTTLDDVEHAVAAVGEILAREPRFP